MAMQDTPQNTRPVPAPTNQEPGLLRTGYQCFKTAGSRLRLSSGNFLSRKGFEGFVPPQTEQLFSLSMQMSHKAYAPQEPQLIFEHHGFEEGFLTLHPNHLAEMTNDVKDPCLLTAVYPRSYTRSDCLSDNIFKVLEDKVRDIIKEVPVIQLTIAQEKLGWLIRSTQQYNPDFGDHELKVKLYLISHWERIQVYAYNFSIGSRAVNIYFNVDATDKVIFIPS